MIIDKCLTNKQENSNCIDQATGKMVAKRKQPNHKNGDLNDETCVEIIVQRSVNGEICFNSSRI